MDDDKLARIVFWVEAYTRAIEALRAALIAAIQRLFLRRTPGDLVVPTATPVPFAPPVADLSAIPRLPVWYDGTATERVAKAAADLSHSARLAVEGAARQYIANIHAEVTDTAPVVKAAKLPPLRGGVDMVEVYARPVEAFQRRMSTTGDEQVALHAAVARAEELADGDVMLTSRDAEHAQMKAHGVTRYRRVIHPEESTTGTCGLCIAASTRVYKIETLQPLHLRCKCTVIEIAGDIDAGALMNEQDLGLLYQNAGSTAGRALKETRYKINEHGEYGPVLTKHGTPFRTPKQIGNDDPIGRAVRELSKLKPTLTILETKLAAGQDVGDALDYQRRRIAFLTKIVDAAA